MSTTPNTLPARMPKVKRPIATRWTHCVNQYNLWDARYVQGPIVRVVRPKELGSGATIYEVYRKRDAVLCFLGARVRLEDAKDYAMATWIEENNV